MSPVRAPNTFLTPTSAARFEELAVERFMKLMQQYKTEAATEPRTNKLVLLPLLMAFSLAPDK